MLGFAAPSPNEGEVGWAEQREAQQYCRQRCRPWHEATSQEINLRDALVLGFAALSANLRVIPHQRTHKKAAVFPRLSVDPCV